ncbi:hypothetical protein CALCODRAFT_501794 [Calocera cornea HHB12733]|uniref:Uncharacterized protein n=1 Tax=Calocera cornea HHB12733 TaxID=1353952 RepID=A0A165DHP0_9BASI|nr:hypothetical protein CALCODRAFT_501794 [Calocera cornea HHB12733]
MVSVKRFILGPEVTFQSHLDVHSVIAHSEHILPIVEAVNKYIRSKHKRGRSQDEIVDKLERLESVYVGVEEVHTAFHIARQENNLPSSRVLSNRAQPYYQLPLRSSSPTPTDNTDWTAAHHPDHLPSGASTAVHSQVDLIRNTPLAPSSAPRRPSVTNSSSWRKFLPGGRRDSSNAQSSALRPAIPSDFMSNTSASPAASVVTLRAAGIEASVISDEVRRELRE